jgi:hypothetical protein
MPQVIQPIFESYGNRFLLFTPIQGRPNHHEDGKVEQSDFMAYLVTPVFDVLKAPLFLVDTAIHLLNTAVTLVNAFHVWTYEQKYSEKVNSPQASDQFKEARKHFVNALSSFFSAFVNPILSTLGWAMRPVASVASAVSTCLDDCARMDETPLAASR